MVTMILLVFAFVCFAISARWNPPNTNLTAVGLAFWVLSVILAGRV